MRRRPLRWTGGQIGGKYSPACGFAMGVERVPGLMVECRGEIPREAPDVYVIHQGELAGSRGKRSGTCVIRA
jgi:histidyl-tRNA synthetase